MLGFGVFQFLLLSSEIPASTFVLVWSLMTVGLLGCWPSFKSYLKVRAQQRADTRKKSAPVQQQTTADRERERNAAKQAAKLAAVQELVSDLSCPLTAAGAEVDTKAFLRTAAVPQRHRTLQLRFQELKAKVCRPLVR